MKKPIADQPKPKKEAISAAQFRAPSTKHDLWLRLLSALVLIPIVLMIVYVGEIKPYGPLAFIILMGVAVSFVSFEWARMTKPNKSFDIGFCLMSLGFLIIIFAHYQLIEAATLSIFIGALLFYFWFQDHDFSGSNAAVGAIYIGLPTLAFVWLRESDGGLFWVIFAFCMAWSSDSAAYVFGRYLKGPKIWPKFSPNKTWAGFIGGVSAGIVAAIFLARFGPKEISLIIWAVIGLLCATATMMGDLWESVIKRRFGVKDAGNLIPGHGGLLDRVDGLMFAVLFVSMVKIVLQSSGASS